MFPLIVSNFILTSKDITSVISGGANEVAASSAANLLAIRCITLLC